MAEFDLLKKYGILGINRRNRDYILPLNPRVKYPLFDDKLKTKELLEKNGIPTPKLYFVIGNNYEFRNLRGINVLEDFVIKPANGAMGRGILVISKKTPEPDVWKKITGDKLTLSDIRYHVSNILAGLYSLGGASDRAFAEYCVKSHEVFFKISYHGVPDVRVVLYRAKPVMCMLRLPTIESEGKANLHQGSVGVGVDMKSGRIFGGVHNGRFINVHPDTGVSLEGIEIPFWEEMLRISEKIAGIFDFGYFGVDFAIDRSLGPLVLELNARPGLNIQIANREGILKRLKEVDKYLK
jgi:alpha-L-glutamate ligase-like protein